MKRVRRRTDSKKRWLAAQKPGSKYEPQMEHIPELSSSRDEEDDELHQSRDNRSSNGTDDSADDGDVEEGQCDFRRQQDENGSFPIATPYLIPDGSFPRLDEFSPVRGGPLSPMPEGSSGASSAASDVAADIKAADSGDSNNIHTRGDESVCIPPSLGSPKTRAFLRSPSMKCVRYAIGFAGALLVMCMVLIAVVMFRGDAGGGVTTPVERAADLRDPSGDLDIFTAPTMLPMSHAPSIAPIPPAIVSSKAPATSAPSPLRVTKTPSSAPNAITVTPMPSMAPVTLSPTLIPTSLPTNVPTLYPVATLQPTQSNVPTFLPSSAPSECADDEETTFDINGTPRTCSFLRESPTYKSLLCNPYNFVATTVCRATCGICTGDA